METAIHHQCRLCMSIDNFQMNIFQEDLDKKQILSKIRQCLPVKVENGDGLPDTICYKCLTQLEQSFDLWNKSFNSEAIFKHNLANGRANHFIKNCKTFPRTAYTKEESQSSDHDTFFVGSSENPTSNEFIKNKEFKESCLESMRQNIHHLTDIHSSFKGYKSPNVMRHGRDEDSERKSCFSKKTPPPTSTTEMSPKSQEEQNNRMGSVQTLWKNNTDVSHQQSQRNNKYIDINLFGEDIDGMHDFSKTPHANEKLFEHFTSKNKKQDIKRRSQNFPWVKFQRKINQDEEATLESERINKTKEKKMETRAQAPGNENVGKRIGFDPNHCPRCNMTLTPSQNLLAHIQSHIEES